MHKYQVSAPDGAMLYKRVGDKFMPTGDKLLVGTVLENAGHTFHEGFYTYMEVNSRIKADMFDYGDVSYVRMSDLT